MCDFIELTIQYYGDVLLSSFGVVVLNCFSIEGVKRQAVFRPRGIGLGRWYHTRFKLEMNYPIELNKRLNIRGRYKVLEKQCK